MTQPTIGLKIDEAKGLFFDRAAVRSGVDRGRLRYLKRSGGFTRKTARRSIRKRKRVAKPGQPPSSRTRLLKDNIFFVADGESVVVGPAELNRSSFAGEPDDALEMLEFGGRTRRRIDVDVGRGDRVEFHRRLGAPLVSASYAPHPFMGPALEKVSPRLPEFWKDAVA